jgi:hypothetical protein
MNVEVKIYLSKFSIFVRNIDKLQAIPKGQAENKVYDVRKP